MIESRSNPLGSDKSAAAETRAGGRASPSKSQSQSQAILRGLLGPLLVGGRPHFDPVGAIVLSEAEKIWTWLERDVSPDITHRAEEVLHHDGEPEALAEFTRTLAATMADQMQMGLEDPEVQRRTRVQIGNEAAFSHLKHIANGFRCQPYLAKAVAFGRALDHQRDEQAIAVSLKSFPARQSPLMPMLMHAALSQVAHPARIVTVIVDLAGGATERAVTQSGFASILDALAAHAQHQLSLIHDDGKFTDMDMACRAVARFHALIRAISIVSESNGHGRWSIQAAKLISQVSDQLAPRIQRIEADIRQSLRPVRAGGGSYETDMLLEALNGLYLLTSVREARDSLGVNSALETAWTQTGQVLETLISRNLEAYKAAPEDEIVARRLDATINMARIRFNPEYAEIIARAKEGATRRPSATDIPAVSA